MENNKFIEPELIKAGDGRVRLGFWQEYPKVDCRVISEDNYQLLKQAYDKMCALEENNRTSNEQLNKPAVINNEVTACEPKGRSRKGWPYFGTDYSDNEIRG